MMKARYIYLYVFACLCICYSANADDRVDNIAVSLDPLYVHEQHVCQRLSYKSNLETKVQLTVSCYKVNNSDSINVYSLQFNNVELKKGVATHVMNFDNNDRLLIIDYDFMDVIKRYDITPAGDYVTYLNIIMPDGSEVANVSYLKVDSVISHQSGLRNEINKIVKAGNSGLVNIPINQHANRLNAKPKIGFGIFNKRLARKTGLDIVPFETNGKSYSSIYYKKWFIGLYELEQRAQVMKRIHNEEVIISSDPVAMLNTDIDNFTSVSSQIRKIEKNKRKDNEVSGTIGLTCNFSNGRETGSAQDNNYIEAFTNFQTEILNIPIMVDAYYTSQDNNRKAKASFVRVQYDVEKAKSDLNRSIYGYKSKYQETDARMHSIKGMAQEIIASMIMKRKGILDSFESEYGVNGGLLATNNGVINTISSIIDTGNITDCDTCSLNKVKNKLIANKEDLQRRYRELEETEKTITRYQALLKQYEQAQSFDSVLSYEKIKGLEERDVSYKDMAKAAEHILPDGKAKSFLSGLTKLNIGILNSYQSNYTMSGQTLKGGEIGYDAGIAKISVALGKTEYISRSGEVDKYSTYLGRIDFKSWLGQKVGLIYYGYAPNKQNIIADDFKMNDDGAMKSYQQPVNILSLTYEGQMSEDVTVQCEGAVSHDRSQKQIKVGMDNTAIKTALVYNLSFIPVNLKGEWEHLGRSFENSTMPYPKSATERYSMAGQAILFKSFLTVGLQFNYLKQQTFFSTGYNTKWGIDLRTNSKQYPNLFLSYKPFSTFRRFDDTLAIEQHPMLGAVGVARVSYQLKRGKQSHRFMFSWNQNRSESDTLTYNSQTIQVGYSYTHAKLMLIANCGRSEQTLESAPVLRSTFINISVGKKLTKVIMMDISQDIAIAKFGIQRNATMIGVSYELGKIPLTLRGGGRYSKIRNEDAAAPQKLWYGQLGINWEFRAKNKN